MTAAAPPRPVDAMENPAPVSVAAPAGQVSTFAPLAEPLFRSLWIAAVVSYTGSWMQNIATGWLMTSLTSSPIWVSLVQVALSLPVLLIALPAGALADVLDRRKFLLFTQSSMVAAAFILGILTITSRCTPTLLLLFTFLLGAGAVMNEPAWQALMPDLVSAPRLGSAIALNSAGFNMARAVGPALGGLVIATAGSGTAFLLNALSFGGVILFLYRWKPTAQPAGQVTTSISGALLIGLRYARQERRITAVLLRLLVFSLSASVFWALLPLIASRFGATGYGAMLALFGMGAIAGAVLLARARRSFSFDSVAITATVIFALALFGLVRSTTLLSSCIFAAAAGLAYISFLATLNLVAQIVSPSWVRARVMSMYVLVLQGGFAVGSLVWGIMASRSTVRLTLTTAAAALMFGLVLAPWFRLQQSSQ